MFVIICSACGLQGDVDGKKPGCRRCAGIQFEMIDVSIAAGVAHNIMAMACGGCGEEFYEQGIWDEQRLGLVPQNGACPGCGGEAKPR